MVIQISQQLLDYNLFFIKIPSKSAWISFDNTLTHIFLNFCQSERDLIESFDIEQRNCLHYHIPEWRVQHNK